MLTQEKPKLDAEEITNSGNGHESSSDVESLSWLLPDEPPDIPETLAGTVEPVWMHYLGVTTADVPTNQRAGIHQLYAPDDPSENDNGDSSFPDRPPEFDAMPESNSAFAVVLPADTFLNHVAQSLHEHRRLIGLATLSMIVLLCAVGWIGVVNSPLFGFASAPPTLALRAGAVMTWPATWTPTPTNMPTHTSTPTVTSTGTRTPKPTRAPSARKVPSATPIAPSPTVISFMYGTFLRSCQHSGGAFIEGTINSPFGEVVGARVSLGSAPGGNVIQTLVTGRDKSPGYYTFVIRAIGPAPGTYYVWVTDTAGKPLSDPNAGRVDMNAIKNAGDPASCWQAFLDFVASH